MKHLAAALLLALPALAQQPQPAPFGEKVDVNLVLIDAIVTDNKGSQILGLDKDDFVVKEDGVAQPIDAVDYFTNRRLLNAPEQSAPFKVERVNESRYFVVFFGIYASEADAQSAIIDAHQHGYRAAYTRRITP